VGSCVVSLFRLVVGVPYRGCCHPGSLQVPVLLGNSKEVIQSPSSQDEPKC
jgi:hypothetical protein